MRYFIDTEFIEYPYTIDLISIGIVCEDGRELYAISQDFDITKASQWVKDNVILKLSPRTNFQMDSLWVAKSYIKTMIIDFIGDDKKPEFWGYYADYDWVAFCQLFGTMMDLPRTFPKYCLDFKQCLWQLTNVGLPKDDFGHIILPKQESGHHNALEDARHLKKCFNYIASYSNA